MSTKHVLAHSGAGKNKKRRSKLIAEQSQKHVLAHSTYDEKKNRDGLLGGIGYTAGKLGLGLAGVAEGVGDVLAAGGDIIRGDTEMAAYRFKDNQTAEAAQALDEWYNPNGVMRFVGDTASGIGQSSVFLLDAVAPGLGTTLFFTGVGGQNVASAAEQTGEVGWRELGYGAASAGLEAVVGKAIGAGGQATKQLGGAILKSTGKTAAKKAAQTAVTKRAWTSVGKEVLKSAIGEGVEEGVSEVADTWLLNWFKIDEDAETSILDVLYAAGVGAVSGGLMTAGPAAINHNQTVKAGRAVKDAGEVDILLQRAKNAVAGATRAENRAKGEVVKGKDKYTAGDNVFKKGLDWNKATFGVNRRAKQESKQAKQIRETLEKNINGYEELSEAVRNSEGGDALLGNLLGNVYLLENAYRVDLAEELIATANPEMKQAFVDDINAKAKATGQKKTDYTVQDLDNDVDGIRRTYASSAVYETMLEKLYGVGNATETAAETAKKAQEGTEKVTGEEVSGDASTPVAEDLSGIEEEVWRAVTDETVKGYGVQNEQEATLLREAVSQNVPEKSIPLMLDRFREGTDLTPAEFADAWADGVLIYGRLGFKDESISKESALSRMSEKARRTSIEYGKYLSEEQREKEQAAAKKKKRPVKEGASKKPKGEVVRHPGINLKADLDDAQFTAYKTAEVMAPALKADIEIHKGLERDGRQVNGYYDLKTNTIHININAVRDGKHIALYTLGHEVTHYIKEWSPKKFYELGDYVMERLGTGAEKAVRDKLNFMKRNGLVDGLDETEAYDRAYEEVVADGMELVLTDGTVLDALARENKTLWQKIKDRIFEIIEKIKKAYNDLSKTSRTAQILSETMDSLDEIEQLFYEGVREAGERTRTAGVKNISTDGGRKFSFVGETKDGRPCYVSGFDDSVSMDERIKVFKNRIATIFNLGAVELKTDVKKIRILGDRFTAQKNLYGDKKGQDGEYNAKISALYDLADILATSTYDPDETNTEESYANPASKPKNKAHEDVKYWYKFKNEIVFDGVPYTVTFNIRDKGKEQYQYLIDFNENKTPGLSNTAVKGLLRADRMSYDDSISQPEEKVKRKFSISEEPTAETPEAEGEKIADVYEIEDETPLEAAARRMRERGAEERGDVWTLEDEDRRRQAIRDHELLADALMETAQSESEYRTVKNYKEKVEMIADAESRITELRKKTAELNREMDSLREKIKGVDKSKREVWVMTALDDATAQKDAYLKEMDELSKMIRKEEAKLLSLAAAKPLQKAIREANKRADAMARVAEKERQRAEEDRERSREREAKTRQKAKEKADERVQKEKDRLERLAGESKERGEITIRKRAVIRMLGALETKMYQPTKTNHVPKELHDLAMKTLAAADPGAFGKNRANIKEMGELAAKIERLEKKADRTAKEQDIMNGWKTRYEELEGETIPLRKQAEAMLTAFIEYNDKAPEDLKYPKGLINIMTTRVGEIEDVPLSKMGLRSLEAVESFVKMLSQQVTSANELFAQKRGEQVSEWGNVSSREASESKPLKLLSPTEMEWKGTQKIRDYLWKNMKPLTAFDAIGSSKLMELFQSILDGEEVWIKDILEAKEAMDKAKKDYGYDKWDHKARRELKTTEGKTVRLTVGELMSLYAYAQREQAKGHLTGGGFKLDPRATEITEKGKLRLERALNQAEAYKMTEEDFVKVASMLTEEQKKYAEKVQGYLTSLGEKGNEVSRKLYGMDAFTEEHYFPIKVISEVLASQTGKTGDPKIKNRGAFQETTPDAKETILLQDFMEIASGHVNDMATYHAFVLPVEDLTRVLNYKPSNVKIDEKGNWVEDTERKDFRTLKEVITAKYGTQAVTYIEQLLRDLNGGARRDAAATLLDKGLTAFKRSATMLSLSTIVQQPTSILRAMAYLDMKYFGGAKMYDYETVKKYAPVASIKEIGGPDTGTGVRTAEYINAKEYDKLGDKIKAAALPEAYGGDPQARAELFGWLTAKADEKAWSYLFGACVNEQAELLKKDRNSEEVLKAAGKRFTEIVRRTQVYDSTLTRSEYMRSKDGLMKMATAFGAEPTTVISMLMDGLIKGQRGDWGFFRKTGAGVAMSIIANAVIVSLVYAARDDDDEETYPEKYLQSLVNETIEGFNPLEYLPVARDVMSLFKGYEIERSDMALVGNLMEQVELITSSKRSVPDKIFGVTGAVSAFFGLPVTNVYRDVKGIVKTGMGFANAEKQTASGFKHATGDAVRGYFGLFSKMFGAESGNAYELYTAYVRGDTAHYERVKARYGSEEAAEMALRGELRDNDKRINQAAWCKHTGELDVYESLVDRIESEGIFDRNIVIRAINNEVSEIKREIEKGNLVPKDEADPEDDETAAAEGLYVTSDMTSAMERGDVGDLAAIIEQMVRDKMDSGKTEKEAKASLRSASTAYWKKRYIAAWEKNDATEMRRIRDALEASGLYGGYNDMIAVVRSWIQNAK